jgi:hypothetical protein
MYNDDESMSGTLRPKRMLSDLDQLGSCYQAKIQIEAELKSLCLFD